MNEPTEQPNPPRPTDAPPSPFDPRPTHPSSSGGGCSKPLMIGCGILLVLLGISAVVFVLNAPKFVRWAFESLGEQVLQTLPEDIPQEDRQRLQRAFQAVGEGAAAGEIQPSAMQRLNGEMQEFAAKPKDEITRDDVRRLAEELEKAAGLDAPAEASP